MPEAEPKNGNGYRVPPWAQQLIYFAGFIAALIFSYASLQSDQRSTTERLGRLEDDVKSAREVLGDHLDRAPRSDVIALELAALRKDVEIAEQVCERAPRADVLDARLRGIDEKIVALTDEVTLQRMKDEAFREHLLSKGVLSDAP